jgi:hypothetical protein
MKPVVNPAGKTTVLSGDYFFRDGLGRISLTFEGGKRTPKWQCFLQDQYLGTTLLRMDAMDLVEGTFNRLVKE